jgi:hypothetical protein
MCTKCGSGCGCNNGSVPEFTSQLMYDGEVFQCVGIPALTIRPCDNLNAVLDLMLGAICDLSQAGLFTNVNIGGGAEVFAQQNGILQEFRTIIGGPGISVTQNPNDITLDTNFTSTGGTIGITVNGGAINLEVLTGSGEVNTASNLGAGVGLYSQKIGVDLQFKSIIAGEGVQIVDNPPTDITINSPCGCAQFYNDQILDVTLPGTVIGTAINIGTTYTVPVGGDGDYYAQFIILISQAPNSQANYFIAVNGSPVTNQIPIEVEDTPDNAATVKHMQPVIWNGTLTAGDVVSVMAYTVVGTNIILHQQGFVMRSGL